MLPRSRLLVPVLAGALVAIISIGVAEVVLDSDDGADSPRVAAAEIVAAIERTAAAPVRYESLLHSEDDDPGPMREIYRIDPARDLRVREAHGDVKGTITMGSVTYSPLRPDDPATATVRSRFPKVRWVRGSGKRFADVELMGVDLRILDVLRQPDPPITHLGSTRWALPVRGARYEVEIRNGLLASLTYIGGDGGTLTQTYSDYGKPFEFELPPADTVISEDDYVRLRAG